MTTVYFHGTAEQAKKHVVASIAMATGHLPDPTGTVSQLQLRMGISALTIIKDAFWVKAQGGTDEAGLSWPPLKRETVAYGRTHPGLETKKKKAANPKRPLLTKKQDALWKKLYTSLLHGLTKKGVESKSAKAIAAANAWITVKAQGGKTILDKYGDTKVEMLRDTGILFNSLSPGAEGDGKDMTAMMSQVFRINPGEVIVGTNVRYAAAHHYGVPKRGIPQRRLWAEVSHWPASWMNRLAEPAIEGFGRLLTKLLSAA